MIIGVPGVDDAYKQANLEAKRRFRNTQLTRGHMNPSGINSFNTNFMKATFTLTNAVPQFEASNNGPWRVFKDMIKDYAKNTCGSKTRQGTLYLLTGRSENGLKSVTKPHVSTTFTVGQNTVTTWNSPGCLDGGMLCVEGARKVIWKVMANWKGRVLCSDEQQSLRRKPATPDTNECKCPGDALEGNNIDNERGFVTWKYKLCSKQQNTIMINRREINTGL